MKNRRTLIIAIICGVAAVALHTMVLNNQIKQKLGPYEEVPVVVATQDITFNARIESNMITVEKIPKKYVQPQSISDPKDVIGYLTALTINAGEQILKTKLSRFEDTHLSLRIPEGMRAVTIGVTDVTGVNGLVRPGNYIDVQATFKFKVPENDPGDAGRGAFQEQSLNTKTYLLFQNILVLAVGNDYRFVNSPFSKDGNDAANSQAYTRNVTLALSPRDAVKLTEAQTLGELSLLLRSHFDTGQEEKIIPQTPFTIVDAKEPIYVPKAAPYLDIRGVR